MKRKSEFKIDETNIKLKRTGNTSPLYNQELQKINNCSISNSVLENQKIPGRIDGNLLPPEKVNFSRLPQTMKESKARIININQDQSTYAKSKREDENRLTHITSDTNKLISKIRENVGNMFKEFNYFDTDEERASKIQTLTGVSHTLTREASKNNLNQNIIQCIKTPLINPNITIHKIDTELMSNNNTQIKLSNPQSVITFKGDTISNSNSKNITSTFSSFKMPTQTQNKIGLDNSTSYSNFISNYYQQKKNLISFNISKNDSESKNSERVETQLREDRERASKYKPDRASIDHELDEFLENNDLNALMQEEESMNFSTGISYKIKNGFPFPLNILISHEKLNPIQEKCFDLLFGTDSNSVITAPTGSGKTVLFEMAVSRVIGQNFDVKANKFFNKNFKIIYLAPIKSLCQEKFFEWKLKFSQPPFDLSVVEATGDSDYLNITQLINANIILSTPERWDVITRKWKDNPHIISYMSLFLIDEIHLLNEEQRGATLEAIIARMKLLSNLPQFENSLIKNFRIIAVSATIPNLGEVAEFLEVDIKTGMKNFGEEYRPVKIEKLVFGYNMAKNEYLFEKYLNYRLADSISKFSDDRPSLVFCQTQKGTINAAMQLLTDIGKLNMNMSENSAARFNLSMQIKDKQLSNLVKNGIAFHNAGLCVEDRQLVEENFKKMVIKIICTTSTLAQGVNLPARLVIIKSTYCYRGPKVGYNEYNKMEIDQMIGRAGRPQFDNKGIAIIMTEKQNVDKYIDMTSCSVCIESHLKNHIIEHINAEITLGTITDIQTAVKWLKNTFMYVRMKNNPEKFGLKKQINRNMVEIINNHLERLCMKMFNDLKDNELITIEEQNHGDKTENSEKPGNGQMNGNNNNISPISDKNIIKARPKSLGQKMSKNYVFFETLKNINKQSNSTEESIIETLSNSYEFSKYNSKMEDRKTLNNFNKDEFSIKFKIKGTIDTANKKAFILLQAALGGLNIDQWELRRQQNEIVTTSIRILNCVKEYFKMKNDARGYINTLLLKKSLTQRMWNDNDCIMKQLPKIGDKLAKSFVKAGINSFEKLVNENPRKLEAICGKNTPFGNILIDIVKSIPVIEFKYEILKNFKNIVKISMVINLPWKKLIHQDDFDPYTNYHIVIVEIATNEIIFKKKIKPNTYNKNLFLNVPNVKCEKFPVNVHIVCDKFIGLDKIISISNSQDQKGTVNNLNASGQMTLFQLYGEKMKNTSNINSNSNNLHKSSITDSNEKILNSSFTFKNEKNVLDLDNEIERIINELDEEIKSNPKSVDSPLHEEKSLKNKQNKKGNLDKENKSNNNARELENTESYPNNGKSNLKSLLNNMKANENTNRKNTKKSEDNILSSNMDSNLKETRSNDKNLCLSSNIKSENIENKYNNSRELVEKFEKTQFDAKTPPRNKNKKLNLISNFEKNYSTACTNQSSTIAKNRDFALDFLDEYTFNEDETGFNNTKTTTINIDKNTQKATQNFTQNRFNLNLDDLL